jgi:hypothetical protein
MNMKTDWIQLYHLDAQPHLPFPSHRHTIGEGLGWEDLFFLLRDVCIASIPKKIQKKPRTRRENPRAGGRPGPPHLQALKRQREARRCGGDAGGGGRNPSCMGIFFSTLPLVLVWERLKIILFCRSGHLWLLKNCSLISYEECDVFCEIPSRITRYIQSSKSTIEIPIILDERANMRSSAPSSWSEKKSRPVSKKEIRPKTEWVCYEATETPIKKMFQFHFSAKICNCIFFLAKKWN